MNPRAFIAALYSVEVVLREAGVLREDENYTLRVPPESGIRLTTWLKSNPPEESIYGDLRFFDTGEICGFTLNGITVQWSVEHDRFVDGPRLAPQISADYGRRRVPRFDFDEQGC